MSENWHTPSQIFKMLENDTSCGIYKIMLKNKDAFKPYNSEFHDEYDAQGKPDIIYIGKAKRNDGLRGRLQNELLQRGRGTFFRSIGGVLKYSPRNNQYGRNAINYTFSGREKEAIIAFMEQNFLVSVLIIKNDTEIRLKEHQLIYEFKPVINIALNSNNSPTVIRERKRCRDIAYSRDIDNAFVNLLHQANENNWCIKPMCTTCSCLDYRAEISRLGTDVLFEAMMVTDTESLMRQKNWQDGTKTAMMLLSPEQRSKLLSHWPKVFGR